MKCCSPLNTRAVPVNCSPSLPDIFATDPPEARFPYRICRCPVFLIGLSKGLITSCLSKLSVTAFSIFSANVLPVTVRRSPWIRPSLRRNLRRAGRPPIRWKSSCIYLPDGLKSPITGVLSEIAWKSSCVRSTPTVRAMAIKCKTAFVEPPRTITTVIASSNASRVKISLGLMSRASSTFIYSPTAAASRCLSSDLAGLVDENGRVIPSVSIAAAIVFAVYMPPQAPCPGIAFAITPW